MTAPAGPGERYVLGPKGARSLPAEKTAAGELPEAYGTESLLLTARDPRWLYAHWDLTRAQLEHYNSQSVDRHLVLRVYLERVHGLPHREIHVHPESRSWFIPVDQGGVAYIAELGYYARSGRWHTLTTSRPTLTPPESVAEDTSVRFATIPIEVTFDQLLAEVRQAVREQGTLADLVQQLRLEENPALPDAAASGAPEWTPAQEEALANIMSLDSGRRLWVGSLEITELIRRQLAGELYSAAAPQMGQAPGPAEAWSGAAVPSPARPYGAREARPAFWFNVNAELIIYGATEPGARVTLGSRPVKLRPDGSFSYRFALPDGDYSLTLTAASPDQADTRTAKLDFRRQTGYRGEVGAHPQERSLKTPSADGT